jgi:hypothetical protein
VRKSEFITQGQGRGMRISLCEGVVVTGIGLIGLIGSIQLEQQLKTTEMGLMVGPAKWMAAISLVLMTCGVSSVISLFLKRKSADGELTVTAPIATGRGMVLIGLLFAWVAAVSTLGFNIGNLCFFPLLFYICGLRPWRKGVVAGLIMAIVFYLVFVLGAKLPVPKGCFGL